MKCPKRRLCRSSQACASFGSSGAGPYSMVTNFSAMLMLVAQFPRQFDKPFSRLRYGMTILCRITPRCIVLQLPLDIAQQSTGAKTKKLGTHPRISELFFHHGQPIGGLLGSANSTGSLEAYSHSGLPGIFAD